MTHLTAILNQMSKILNQEDGQGLMEYSLLFVFIVIVLLVAVTSLGVTVQTVLYDQLATQLF